MRTAVAELLTPEVSSGLGHLAKISTSLRPC
jgi:hypothetical protein